MFSQFQQFPVFHRSILRDAHSQLSTSLEIKAGGSAEPPTPGESREGRKGGKTKPWTAEFGHGDIQDVGWGLSVTVPKPKLLQRNGKKPPWEYPTFIKSAIKTNSSGPGSREWENQPGIPARGCGGCPALGVSTDIPKMRGPSHKCGVHPIPGMQEEFSTSPGADLGVQAGFQTQNCSGGSGTEFLTPKLLWGFRLWISDPKTALGVQDWISAPKLLHDLG